MRRTILRTLALLTLTVGLLALPSGASASVPVAPMCDYQDSAYHACNTKLSSLSYYKGWASLSRACHRYDPNGPSYAPQAPYDAWRWTGTRWQVATMYPGQRVYIWPYAKDWSWAWTQQTGWLAVHDSIVVINQYCIRDYAMTN